MNWTTDRAAVYRWEDGYPYLVTCTGVKDAVWDITQSTTCPYCGSEMRDGVCAGCQNTAIGDGNSGITAVTFYSYLRPYNTILNIYPGQVFDIVYLCDGNITIYENAQAIIRLTVLRMLNRTIPKLCALDPFDEDLVYIYVTVECKFEVIIPEEDTE